MILVRMEVVVTLDPLEGDNARAAFDPMNRPAQFGEALRSHVEGTTLDVIPGPMQGSLCCSYVIEEFDPDVLSARQEGA